MPIKLGSPLSYPSRRCFLASIDGRPALVELDNGAIFKLAERTTEEALAVILDKKRDQITDAARRLIQKGHVVERDGRLELIVTALDL